MSVRVLYSKKRVPPESFWEALRALAAGGYQVAAAPAKNRDGVSVRLKKEEEVWLEWFDSDHLTVTAAEEPKENLREEVGRLLATAEIREIPVV